MYICSKFNLLFFFQIVIQIGGDAYRDGSVLIRTSENRQGHCPVQCLQEV